MLSHEYPELQLPLRPEGGFPEEHQDLGKITLAVLVCPGVYHIETEKTDKYPYGAEWMLVLPDSPVIPPKTRAYGIPLPSCPDIVLFMYESGDGWPYFRYEFLKYQCENGLRQPAYLMNAEQSAGKLFYPQYFGEFEAPEDTPWGPTLRSKRLENGLFWIEAPNMDWGLAVCYPLAQDLEKATLNYAELTDFDRQIGVDKTCGYYFFPRSALCVAFFNLRAISAASWREHVDRSALHNALLEFFPEYVDWCVSVSTDPDRPFLKDFKNEDSASAGTDFWRGEPFAQ